MKFHNPARHYPSYLVHVYLKDGRKLNVRGSCTPEISIPMNEEDVLATVVKIVNASREVVLVRLLVDGEWSDYSEEALEAVLTPPKPRCRCKNPESCGEAKMCSGGVTACVQSCKLKSKTEPKIEPKPEPESEDYGNEYGLGCS